VPDRKSDLPARKLDLHGGNSDLPARICNLRAGKLDLPADKSNVPADKLDLHAGKLNVQAGKLDLPGGRESLPEVLARKRGPPFSMAGVRRHFAGGSLRFAGRPAGTAKVLDSRKHPLRRGMNEIRLVVAAPPASVTVDPWITRIDRNPADNEKLF